jgi:hypothetical protein
MKIRRLADGRSLFSFLITALVIAVLIGGIFGIVWSGSSIIAVEYHIAALESRIHSALKERKELDASLSGILSMRAVEGRGLMLQFPDRQNIYYVVRESKGVQRASVRRGGASEEAR